MPHFSRRQLLGCILLATTFLAAPFEAMARKSNSKTRAKPAELALPTMAHRRLEPSLAEFSRLVKVHRAEDSDIVIEVGFMPNITGLEKELPDDLGFTARTVLENIGSPFKTYRPWPTPATMKGNAFLTLKNDQPKPPQAIYRIVGELARASEQEVKESNSRIDIQAKKLDAGITNNPRLTITCVTVGFHLETPDGLAVPGATATFKILVAKTDADKSFSFYLAGSGLGGGSKSTVTQDLGDALYDATAAGVMTLLGHALQIPYYRCSPIFSPDELLDSRKKNALTRMTRAQLLENMKVWLWVDGFPMDLSTAALTDADRAIAVLQMHSRGLLDFVNQDDLIEFSFQTWKTLNYDVRAAQRVQDRMNYTARMKAEELARQRIAAEKARIDEEKARIEAENAARELNPVDFGFAPDDRIVVLDLSQVKDVKIQKRILAAAARACKGKAGMRMLNPANTVAVIRVFSPERAQRSLRYSFLPVDYKWTDTHQQRLSLLPKNS